MAAPEKWWIVALPARPTAQEVIASPSKPGAPQWLYISGPYPTKAKAQAALTKKNKPPDLPGIPNPLSGLSDIGKVGHWLGDIVLHIVDGAMWRSIGWLLLGAVLVFAGIYLWFRTSATYDELQSAIIGVVK